MSKEMREQINRVKNWKQFLNESLKGKLSFLEGKPISLIKTLHTVGKWNDEKREMNKVTKDEDFDGVIGQIGDYDGYETPGFWVMDDNGKRKGFIMFDKKTGEFVEGNSMYHYTYQGKTEKDNRILQLFLDNLSTHNEDINESDFGFGEFPKPKTEIWIQLMNRARKDGLLSDIHYGDKRIQNIAKELADEFEKMEEPNRQSNKYLFLSMFYKRIPQWAWGEPTNSILMKYDLKKS